MKSIVNGYSNMWDSDPIIDVDFGDFITNDGVTGYLLPGLYENSLEERRKEKNDQD